ERLGCEAQNETTVGECVYEAVLDLPEGKDRVPDSRSRGIPEIIVIGVPKNRIPRAAAFKVDVDAVESEGCNQVEHRIDEGGPIRIRIECEGPAGRAADRENDFSPLPLERRNIVGEVLVGRVELRGYFKLYGRIGRRPRQAERDIDDVV